MKKFSILILALMVCTNYFAQNSEPLTNLTHQTKNISATVWNDGFIGDNPVDGKDGHFIWKGQDGIYCAGIVFGTTAIGSVNGSYGEGGHYIDDWRNFESSFKDGFMEETVGSISFDQVSKTILRDNGVPVQNYGSGFKVIQKSYSINSENFIFFRYGFVNSTGSDIQDLYVGHTTGWEIGNQYDNTGGIDLDLNLTYACKSDLSGPYFGVVVIDSLYGCKLTNAIPLDLRTETFKYISTIDTIIPTNCDIGTIGGTYIDFIPQDSTSWVTFAYVAGDNLTDLKANAERAIDISDIAEEANWSDITSAVEKNNLVNNNYALKQNYPNPFNPTTTINYSIPLVEFGFVPTTHLAIYDILGQEVEVLINKKQNPGNYEVTWNAGNFTSGVYFCKLQVGSFIETRKMILLR